MKTFRYIESAIDLSITPEKCIGCAKCVTVCPHRVFTLSENKATISDLGRCIECGGCSLNCPTGAIELKAGIGCGCATLLINRWLSRFFTKNASTSSCC